MLRYPAVSKRQIAFDAQNDLMRQFMAQWKKDGLIIDERRIPRGGGER